MKKFLSIIIATVIMAASLCSCGCTNTENNTTGTDENGNITNDSTDKKDDTTTDSTDKNGNNTADDLEEAVDDTADDIKDGMDNTKDAIDDALIDDTTDNKDDTNK